jgi:hypothetical protein
MQLNKERAGSNYTVLMKLKILLYAKPITVTADAKTKCMQH